MAVRDLTDAENDRLIEPDVVTWARSGVERDFRARWSRMLPEMPARFTKQLAQVVRGALYLLACLQGRHAADPLRAGQPSREPLRRDLLLDVAANPSSSPDPKDTARGRRTVKTSWPLQYAVAKASGVFGPVLI